LILVAFNFGFHSACCCFPAFAETTRRPDGMPAHRRARVARRKGSGSAAAAPCRNLWRSGFVLASRELRLCYLGSVLGSVWSFIHAPTFIVIYTVIFGQLMKSRVPGVEDGIGYGIFLCAGIFTWSAFTEILQRSVAVFLENGNLMKKMSFPRATLPAIVLLSALVNFAIMFGMLLLMPARGRTISRLVGAGSHPVAARPAGARARPRHRSRRGQSSFATSRTCWRSSQLWFGSRRSSIR
jgi:hypothetical protein